MRNPYDGDDLLSQLKDQCFNRLKERRKALIEARRKKFDTQKVDQDYKDTED